jgi:CheY-like chemotaxis protein/tetratricopeptide (TPR) repeat protein
MDLTSQLIAQREETRGLTRIEQAAHSCKIAKQLEKAGEYEAAAEALVEFWPERGNLPHLDGLDESTKAAVLLRVGALSGWLGGTDQAHGSQETAKDLITRSLQMFERLGQTAEAAEAHGDLALCYWREGAYDEARIHLARGLSFLDSENSDLKASLLIRAGIIEERTHRLQEALRFYSQAAPLVESSDDHALKGAFHTENGLIFRKLAAPENREDYLDRALMEYTAASFHFEQAGNARYLARVENNLGYLFFTIGKFNDAYKHLDRARHLFLELKDVGAVAQVDETRARTLLAEDRLTEAERMVRYAVHTLENGDEQSVLAEALNTHGIALARLGNYLSARSLLQRSVEVAERVGNVEGAGRAMLSMIEELSGQTPAPQLVSVYESAAELLQDSQDPGTAKRLVACGLRVIAALNAQEPEEQKPSEPSWEGFSLKKETRKLEKAIIERALRDAGGSVTTASRLLGFRHHQSLISIINGRHPDLLRTRSAIRKRRRHLFSQPKRNKKRPATYPQGRPAQITILEVEDQPEVAGRINDLLTAENYQLELCGDGDNALRKLTGNDFYDIVVIDNEVPGLSGLELVQRARKITHRRRTPIIMLSSHDQETEAWRAGVDAFVKKPEEIGELPATIARLLRDGSRHG